MTWRPSSRIGLVLVLLSCANAYSADPWKRPTDLQVCADLKDLYAIASRGENSKKLFQITVAAWDAADRTIQADNTKWAIPGGAEALAIAEAVAVKAGGIAQNSEQFRWEMFDRLLARQIVLKEAFAPALRTMLSGAIRDLHPHSSWWDDRLEKVLPFSKSGDLGETYIKLEWEELAKALSDPRVKRKLFNTLRVKTAGISEPAWNALKTELSPLIDDLVDRPTIPGTILSNIRLSLSGTLPSRAQIANLVSQGFSHELEAKLAVSPVFTDFFEEFTTVMSKNSSNYLWSRELRAQTRALLETIPPSTGEEAKSCAEAMNRGIFDLRSVSAMKVLDGATTVAAILLTPSNSVNYEGDPDVYYARDLNHFFADPLIPGREGAVEARCRGALAKIRLSDRSPDTPLYTSEKVIAHRRSGIDEFSKKITQLTSDLAHHLSAAENNVCEDPALTQGRGRSEGLLSDPSTSGVNAGKAQPNP